MQGRVLTIVFAASLMSAVTLAAQTPAPRSRTPAVLPITAIAVTGNKTFSSDAILAASGLKINDSGGATAFDAARDRLLETGYFDAVSYSFRQQDQGFAIAFTVSEFKQLFPLRVAALPIGIDQVKQILKTNDPLFDGLLPPAKKVIDRAASELEQYLSAANPDLHVRATVVEAGPERFEIQFAPAEGLPVIADVTFEGSAVVKDSDMHDVMIENGIGQPFSDASIGALLDRLIRPLFEKQGYMRVTFPKIVSQPATTVKGIDVHVTVADGPRFRLGALSVKMPSVDQAGSNDSRRILRMANVQQGDFVNGDDIAEGVSRIRDTLRGEGYLDVTVSTDRSINDAAKTVDAWFDVNPGALYTFGHLEVLNLGLDGEAAIRKLWSVKPGDPFPSSYPDHFVQAVKDEGLFDNLGDIKATPSINRQTHVVDVSLHFGSAPPADPRRRAQF